MTDRRARPPAVAGRFYPADRDALTALVDGLLDAVPVTDGEPLAAAYVVPHAGLRYSGPTAAHVYARLRTHAAAVNRVVLIGPAHYVPLKDCAVPAADRWSTPLGELSIDVEAVRELAARGRATVDDAPHAPEHSLEVQLPFVQRALGDEVLILPVAIGQSSVEDAAAAVAAADEAGNGGGTVVLCSTDLSHYLEDGAAREQDARTAEAVLALAPDRIGPRDACGVFALRGLVEWARRGELRPELLHLSTSAETAGDTSRVVGYSAFAFYPTQR